MRGDKTGLGKRAYGIRFAVGRMKCVSPMYGACRRGGEVVVVCMPMSGGHSQDRPSLTRGQSQHVEAKSKPSRVATSVTAAPPSGEKLSVTMRTHKRFTS